jgi:hypothetical protein
VATTALEEVEKQRDKAERQRRLAEDQRQAAALKR